MGTNVLKFACSTDQGVIQRARKALGQDIRLEAMTRATDMEFAAELSQRVVERVQSQRFDGAREHVVRGALFIDRAFVHGADND